MNKKYRILLLGILAVILLDSVGSLTSRAFNYNYSDLGLGSFIIYGATAFFAARQYGLSTGVLFAAILGFFDASVGWAISTALNANTDNVPMEITPVTWAIAALFNTCFAALIGLIAGWLAIVLKGKGQ